MRRRLLRAAAGLLAAALLPAAAPAQAEMYADGHGMLLYTHALTIEYDGNSLTGGAFSVAADIALRGRFVGRAQLDILDPGSLSGAGADEVQSGLAIVGSIGYRWRPAGPSRYSIDILAHGGYAQVTYTTAGTSDVTDASPQFGLGVAPHINFTDRLAISLQFRFLQGADAGEGTAINRTDFGFGGRLTLF